MEKGFLETKWWAGKDKAIKNLECNHWELMKRYGLHGAWNGSLRSWSPFNLSWWIWPWLYTNNSWISASTLVHAKSLNPACFPIFLPPCWCLFPSLLQSRSLKLLHLCCCWCFVAPHCWSPLAPLLLLVILYCFSLIPGAYCILISSLQVQLLHVLSVRVLLLILFLIMNNRNSVMWICDVL